MQVTDEMIERGLAEYSEGGCMGLDDRERRQVVTAILTAALSDQERVVEVKAVPLKWSTEKRSGFTIHIGRGLGLKYEAAIKVYSPGWIVTIGQSEVVYDSADADEDAAKAAAQANYEQRIRSALVDVPAVGPVGEAVVSTRLPGFTLATFEESEVPAGTKLYTSPPLSREGEDSAEVERLTRPIVGIEHRTAQEVFDIMADRIRFAATRSGSATTQKGCAE